MVFTRCFVWLLMLPFMAAAQEIELNPVTVTATLNPVTASQTGRNIVVIKGEALNNLPVHSIDDLLRYLPGLEVQARGPMGTQSDFVVRGGTFQQVLVIIDGLRVNDPNTGHFSSYIPIAPSEIERIEVLKGASSALYGSDAVGGVIHIITKTFATRTNTPASKQLDAAVMAGQYGFWHAQAGAYLQQNKTAVALGAWTNNAKGQALRGTKGFFNLHTFSLSASHQLHQNWQLALRSAFDYRSFAAQNYYTTSVADTATEKVKTFWNQLQLSYRKNKNKLSFSAGYKTVDDHFRFNPVIVANENLSKLLQSLLIYEHSFSAHTTLITGLQFQDRSISSNDRGNHHVRQAAAFLQLQQSVAGALQLSPALRYDWDERSGAELVPQINLSYNLAEFQLRGSAGKTIRQADFTERYNNYNKAIVPNLNRVGNPDLQAERSFSYEAGFDVFAGKSFKISATYFNRDHKDLIDYVFTPYSQMPRQENLLPTGNYFLAKNIANTRSSGFETDLQFSKQLDQLRLFAVAGAVWIETDNDSQPSLYIASHANLLFNFALQVAGKRFAFSVTGLYKERNAQTAALIGARVHKDYFVLHAKAEAFLVANKLSVQLQADNLLDRQYSDLLGASMPRRWLMAGVRLSL